MKKNVKKHIILLTIFLLLIITIFFSKPVFADTENSIEKDITELDIGIGVLYIRHIGDQVAYKFIPSEDLEKTVNTTIIKKQNLLENVLNDSLAKKFMDVYKDLC